MQSPSSLIFLVLLGVWAAYFVQYWVRRRDHLATARTVEQFSEAMRVLERRDPLPRTDLSDQAPRSYAVHPARANRPQVLVKRAVAAETASPLTVTARVTDRDGAGRVQHPNVPAGAHGATPRPAAAGGATSASASRPATRPDRVTAVRPRLRPSRRVRGLFVLASLAELLVIVPLVVLGMLPLWALATAALTVVATFAYLRSGVRAEQAMMRAHRRRQGDLARPRSSAPVTSPVVRHGAGSRPAPARPAASTPESASSVDLAEPALTAGPAPAGPATATATAGPAPATATAEPVATQAALSPLDVALEVAPATEAPAPVVESSVVEAEVMVPILDEDDMPLTWDPVPVPRPTYTMKARAERREVAPAAVTPDPAPVVRDDAAGDTAYDQRRVAGA